MQMKVKFIVCSYYNFTDSSTGQVLSGYSCRCFDETSKSIIKVKSDRQLPYNFGDEVTVDVIMNGRYVNYRIAE